MAGPQARPGERSEDREGETRGPPPSLGLAGGGRDRRVNGSRREKRNNELFAEPRPASVDDKRERRKKTQHANRRSPSQEYGLCRFAGGRMQVGVRISCGRLFAGAVGEQKLRRRLCKVDWLQRWRLCEVFQLGYVPLERDRFARHVST